MTIRQIDINPEDVDLPKSIEKIIRAGWENTRSFQDRMRTRPVKGFHSSDFEDTYRWLSFLRTKLCHVEKPTFCEWGGGLAVVSLLAERIGYHATSIESDPNLHRASIQFHEEHESSCRCVEGSFIPIHFFEEHHLEKPEPGQSMWLDFDCEEAYERTQQRPDEFDVVYAYPWPGEAEFVFALFDKLAKSTAFLLTFHGAADFRLHQKL